MPQISRRCIPYTPNRRPLKDTTVALVTTAGVHLRDQAPFNPDGEKEFRIIPGDARTADLMITHPYYDHADADRDINCVFPLDRLREFVDEGSLAAVGNYNVGYMGTSPMLRDVYEATAPGIADRLERSKADAVVLTAGCPHVCHRTVVAIQREIEMRGLPTVLITVSPEASLQAGPPRALYPVGFEIGHVLGGPFEVEVQRAVLRDALELLVKPMEPGSIEERQYPAHKASAAAAQ